VQHRSEKAQQSQIQKKLLIPTMNMPFLLVEDFPMYLLGLHGKMMLSTAF
jgi:hypothetical protein